MTYPIAQALGKMTQPASATRRRTQRGSLKRRLSVLLTSLFALVFLLASTVYVLGARQAVGLESRAAAQLVDALLINAPRKDGVPLLPDDALHRLERVRHIRAILVGQSDTVAQPYPDWFAGLFEDNAGDWSRRIDVTGVGHAPAPVLLVSTAADELAEKWSDVGHMAGFLLLLLFLLNMGAAVIVSWQLHPLQALRVALERVGSGGLDVRVDASAVEEVAAVQQGFNQMAEALRDAGDRNRQLTRELLRVQEEERRAIARELHDEFAQHLTAMDAEATALQQALQGSPDAMAGMASIRTGAQYLMRMVRGRLEQLRPEVLDEFGIVAAIEELCEAFRRGQPQIRLETSLPVELPISEERSIAVFRILQESLTNVARHSKATRVWLTVERVTEYGLEMLHLSIVDDGVGIEAVTPTRQGFGLLGMKERLESLGGHLRIGAGPEGVGAHVNARLPLIEAECPP